MLIWHVREEFWKLVAGRLGENPPKIPWHFEFPLSMLELRSRIAIPPEFTPEGDGDFPGPVERWYGEASGHLFTLTLHYKFNLASAEVECSACNEAEAAIQNELEAFKRQYPYA